MCVNKQQATSRCALMPGSTISFLMEALGRYKKLCPALPHIPANFWTNLMSKNPSDLPKTELLKGSQRTFWEAGKKATLRDPILPRPP